MNISNSWFCSGFFFKKVDEVWYALGVTDQRYPDEVKSLGGCKKKDEHPDDTLRRELKEETKGKLIVKNFEMIHDEIHRNHDKHFYLVTEMTGDLELDEELKIIEPDENMLIVKYWKLEDFSKHLFGNYHRAFRKAAIKMREIDQTFPNV